MKKCVFIDKAEFNSYMIRNRIWFKHAVAKVSIKKKKVIVLLKVHHHMV